MDSTLTVFLVLIAVLTGLPGWLAGAVIKRHAQKEGETPNDWIPFGLLPYAFTRFRHPNRAALTGAYLLMNLVSWAALVALFVVYLAKKG